MSLVLDPSAGTPRRHLPAGARIEAQQLRRTLRGGAAILTDVSLTIQPGSLVAVIGASGAGKTTLLETLAGLRRPSSGRVLLDGTDLLAHHDELRAHVGYVPQDDIIHRDLPVRSTVLHAARLRLADIDRDDLSALVDGTIDRLGLTERASTVVGRLSGGQRKRVSIAVELLSAPRVLFLDEPTSGLDPASARSLLATLAQLASAGSTVVLTTHSPDDVVRCDEVVVVARGGRVAFHGTPDRGPRPLRRGRHRRHLRRPRRRATTDRRSAAPPRGGARAAGADAVAEGPTHRPPGTDGRPDPPQRRGAGAQPADPGHHARGAGAGDQHVRRCSSRHGPSTGRVAIR